jgi:hypothetical protein
MFADRQEAQEEAKASMVMAQEHAKWYFDQHHSKVPFKVGDMVMIRGKDIHIHLKKPLSDKLAAKQHGPFKIVQQYGGATFRVELTPKYKLRHPVFHAQKFIPHHKDNIGNRNPEEPEGEVVEEGEDVEYDVEKIEDSKVINGKVKYLVKWTGYSDQHNLWQPLWTLRRCHDKIKEFHAKNPDAPQPISMTNATPISVLFLREGQIQVLQRSSDL